ncbi:glycosyl hydrolase family 28-related protein [Tistrella mobilis]|uniref:glycosyl hydrolase family 28-related protein n=1 Tax=Tistrella mobilis TaxID=171437 RepID=UPI0031F6FACB
MTRNQAYIVSATLHPQGQEQVRWTASPIVPMRSVNMAAYSSTSMVIVDTVADIPAVDVTQYKTILCLGYHQTGDGSGGTFRYDPTSTMEADQGLAFQPAFGPGRWLRVVESAEPLSVKWWGAKGDNSRDDSDSIQAALNAARRFDAVDDQMNPPADPPPTHPGRKDLVTVHFPPGTYKVTKTLFINRGMRVTGARKNFSLISFQDMPADADGLRAWKYELNGTGIVMERLQLRAGDLGTGAMLSIRGAHESLIEDVTFYGKDGTSPSTALRILNSQDITLSRLVFHRVGKLGAPVMTGAALSIFKDVGAGSVAPNNIYLNDCRWENTTATPIALKNCRGIYFQGGKIDQSFGSEVEDNAPGFYLEDATGTEVHRFFIGGIKGPVAHLIGYSNLLMADTRMGPGLYDAFFTGDPAYGDPSESGFLPGRILTPQITLRNCTVDLSALNVTSRVASVFKIPLKDYRQYTGLAIAAVSYDPGTDTTRADVMTGPGWSSSVDSVRVRPRSYL